MHDPQIVPRFYVKSRGEHTTKLALQLSQAPRKCVVRVTGGCGLMSAEHAEGLHEMFGRAFVGFDGAMLFGGTRMIQKDDTTIVTPGITEVPPRLRGACPQMTLLGVIPRTADMGLAPDAGMILSNEPDKPYLTVVHPLQDIALVVQISADDPEIWDAEYQECMRLTEALRSYANFTSVLVSYNGGMVTEREILATAAKGWPVILLKGSGRKTDEYASNTDFLALHRNVVAVETQAEAFRAALATAGAVPMQRLTLVRNKEVG